MSRYGLFLNLHENSNQVFPICSLITKLCPPRLGGRAVVGGGGRGVGLSPICHFVTDLSR